MIGWAAATRHAVDRSLGAVRDRVPLADAALPGDRLDVPRRLRAGGPPDAAGGRAGRRAAPRSRSCSTPRCSCRSASCRRWSASRAASTLAGALALGLAFLVLAIRFARRRTATNARRLFLGSISYLPLLWGLMLATALTTQAGHERRRRCSDPDRRIDSRLSRASPVRRARRARRRELRRAAGRDLRAARAERRRQDDALPDRRRRLLRAERAGTVRVFGDDVVRAAAAVRRRLGVVFQSPALDERLTVAENLAHQGHLYGLRGRRAGAAHRGARCAGAARRPRGRHRVGSLSGGLAAPRGSREGAAARPAAAGARRAEHRPRSRRARRDLWQDLARAAGERGHDRHR